eukprot:scaffold96408_cov29-Attheya_sp.AAC.1
MLARLAGSLAEAVSAKDAGKSNVLRTSLSLIYPVATPIIPNAPHNASWNGQPTVLRMLLVASIVCCVNNNWAKGK